MVLHVVDMGLFVHLFVVADTHIANKRKAVMMMFLNDCLECNTVYSRTSVA